MRQDGRAADELRPLKITRDYMPTADGSVLIELGHTRVICTASIEERVPAFLKGEGKGHVAVEYGILPRAMEQRTAREAVTWRTPRTIEAQNMIFRCLRSIVYPEKLGERTITIDCDVIQADGGTRTTAVTGAFCALWLAVQRLVSSGKLATYPLADTIAAVSVGMVEGQPLLDMCYEEDREASVDMRVVKTAGGRYVEIHSTGEYELFGDSQIPELLALAGAGIRRITQTQRDVLGVLT